MANRASKARARKNAPKVGEAYDPSDYKVDGQTGELVKRDRSVHPDNLKPKPAAE